MPSQNYAEEAVYLLEHNTTLLSYLLAFSGIKYIVVTNYIYNTTWPHAYGEPYLSNWGYNYFITGSPAIVNNLLNNSLSFKEIFQIPNVTIYNNINSKYPFTIIPFELSNPSNISLEEIINAINYTNNLDASIITHDDYIHINISSPKEKKTYYIVMDFMYNKNWKLICGNKVIDGIRGPFGLQAFNVSDCNSLNVTLYFNGADTYKYLNYTSITIYIIISIIVFIIILEDKIKERS
ncbi:hypothetical protein J5U23_01441 [Saccharolobus shibatae B12]|uniref:Uncharacterized protein n=1 Tax=Saccharolobus shibatae (strain ATCC 51178 / DSM 5389 / JCM 8931 / NBRC 15437 / B12) TaxID=523848 RepID=A0A8F5BNK3_SACSH|nr:hypothetical protein [Saccharolobus shibatae]QXJ28572.1 hypothetical protein J5U23_01441 [Saccharolobus shibatae B12]